MAELLRFNGLAKKLRAKVEAAGDAEPVVLVGYTAAYALYVHENLEMKLKGQPRSHGKGLYWDPQGRGQAKFLEQPARENQTRYAEIVKAKLLEGKTLAQALLVAGLALQRDSQELVPIDTGNLRASAFTRPEEKK